MSFLNIGERDQDGRQKRIEHRGKHLRASRTGGVSLREQVKIAGVTITANSSHGLRVSTRVAKNTRIAMQNGRFVFQGRYGSGPTRLNLSKTGATVSTRNALGSFNWVRPNRSSVKFAGVQLRGKNAANIQLFYMLFMVVGAILKLGWLVFSGLLQLLTTLVQFLFSWPGAIKQRRDEARLQRYIPSTKTAFNPSISTWSRAELLAAVQLVLIGWGRGLQAEEAAQQIQLYFTNTVDNLSLLRTAEQTLMLTAKQLERALATYTDKNKLDPLAVMAVLAEHADKVLSPEDKVEAILSADELILALGERTELQDELLQVLTDFSELQFQAMASKETPLEPLDEQSSIMATANYAGKKINLNTANLEQLQALPHVGAERAYAIIAMRPIVQLSQLQAISGIGPERLATIIAAGVEL